MATDLHEVPGTKYVKKPSNNRLVGEYPISHAEDKDPFLLRACEVLPTGDLLLLDKANKHIKLVDKEYNCVSVMKFSTYPFDICVSKRRKNEFYVTEPEEQTLHCIMAGQGRMTKYKTYKIFEDCRGVTCWKSGIAVSVMREGFIGTLGFLDYDGKIKKKVWESDDHRDLFKAPWYLDSIRGGNQVIVSDQGNHSVICLEVKTLLVIFLFKNENLIGPRTLTVDSEENIYVIGSSERCHNVVKISPEGKLKGIMLSRKDKLNYPSGIAYNASDNTIVLQRNRENPAISVYRL